jgi:hypothetical protein
LWGLGILRYPGTKCRRHKWNLDGDTGAPVEPGIQELKTGHICSDLQSNKQKNREGTSSVQGHMEKHTRGFALRVLFVYILGIGVSSVLLTTGPITKTGYSEYTGNNSRHF